MARWKYQKMGDELQVLGDRKKKRHIDDLLKRAGEEDTTIKRVLDGKAGEVAEGIPKKPEDWSWALYYIGRMVEYGFDANNADWDWGEIYEEFEKIFKNTHDWHFDHSLKYVGQFAKSMILEPRRYYPRFEIVYFFQSTDGEEFWIGEPPEYKPLKDLQGFKIRDIYKGDCDIFIEEDKIYIEDTTGTLKNTLNEEDTIEETISKIADFLVKRINHYEKHGQVEIPENE